MSLLVKKHPQADFFIADIFDSTPLKDDMASMEHPVFTLSIKPDRRVFEYKNGEKEIKVTPSIEGLPTIFDKDFLMYCCSLMMSNYNEGIRDDPSYLPPKTIRVSAHDYFKATERADNGKAYMLFDKSLLRLRGCTVTTTIRTNGKKQQKGFGLIDSYEIIESSKIKNRMVALEITLSDWLYNSIVGREMLTINKDYFRLRKPLERRLYEIAKKHCGAQLEWKINIENLFAKTGSSGTLRKFRFNLLQIIKDSHIPDYSYSLANDKVTITNLDQSSKSELAKETSQDDKTHELILQLRKDTISKACKIHKDSYTDWSMREIAIQFAQYVDQKGIPKSLDGAFIGFVKKKVDTFKKDSTIC